MVYYKIAPGTSEIRDYAWWRDAHEAGCLFTPVGGRSELMRSVCTAHNFRKVHKCADTDWPINYASFVPIFTDDNE